MDKIENILGRWGLGGDGWSWGGGGHSPGAPPLDPPLSKFSHCVTKKVLLVSSDSCGIFYFFVGI